MKTTRVFLTAIVLIRVIPDVIAQGTAFTYQWRLTDNAAAANGSYDLRFAIYDSTNAPGVLIAGPLTNAPVSVGNGLFTVLLDFGSGVFDGDPRWLEIGIRPEGSSNGYTVLSPRQPLTPSPYAIYAGGANAAGLTGTIPSAAIGNGSIGASQLASGAAAANLQAGGLTGVPGGGMILSSNSYDNNLANAGYVKLDKVDLEDAWTADAVPGPPSGRTYVAAVWSGSEMIVWGGFGTTFVAGLSNDGGRYHPAADTWTPVTTLAAPRPRSRHTAVWTGHDMIVWGGYSASGDVSDTFTFTPTRVLYLYLKQ